MYYMCVGMILYIVLEVMWNSFQNWTFSQVACCVVDISGPHCTTNAMDYAFNTHTHTHRRLKEQM